MGNPTASALLAYGDPTPVIGGAIAVFAAIGLAIFGRLRKRQADFKLAAEQHGFEVMEPRPRFVGNWRTLASKSEGIWALEIREERVAEGEEDAFFQEITLRSPATGGLEFLFRPKSRWRKLEPEGEARNVEIGDAEFDRIWFVETNRPQLLIAALTPELRAHFDGLQPSSGPCRVSLKQGLIVIRGNRYFLPAARFDHAMKLVQSLARVAEEAMRLA
ncbi:MAG TPA: hypothetical protein VK961_24980 [Chthoniobacter sp.]|nr:hypothetical protein [Chthoniobacter sp.]